MCKSCQRALCLNCVAEVGKSLACKDRCESDVKSLDEMLKRSMELTNSPDFKQLSALSSTTLASSRVALTTADLFNIVLGAIFLGYSAYDPNTFIALLGAAFVAFGVFGVVRAKLASRKEVRNGKPTNEA